jgi:hypothetical protein
MVVVSGECFAAMLLLGWLLGESSMFGVGN